MIFLHRLGIAFRAKRLGCPNEYLRSYDRGPGHLIEAVGLARTPVAITYETNRTSRYRRNDAVIPGGTLWSLEVNDVRYGCSWRESHYPNMVAELIGARVL